MIDECNTNRDDPGSGTAGLLVVLTANCSVEHTTVRRVCGAGIWFEKNNKDFSVNDCLFTGNVGRASDQEGVGIGVTGCPGGGRIENSTFYQNSGSAVKICESSGVVVRGNTMSDCFSCVELRDMTTEETRLGPNTIRKNTFKAWKESALLSSWDFCEKDLPQ